MIVVLISARLAPRQTTTMPALVVEWWTITITISDHTEPGARLCSQQTAGEKRERERESETHLWCGSGLVWSVFIRGTIKKQ